MQSSPLVGLALRVACRPVAGVDLVQLLTEVTAELAAALGVAGVVVVVPEAGCVVGSNPTATLVGELQHRAVQGPLPTAVRTARGMVTPDLTRVGPPPLAALAAEAGLVSSAAVALIANGRPVGGLQVLGRHDCPVTDGHIDALGPVLDVLAARIADVLEFRRMSSALMAARAAGGQPVVAGPDDPPQVPRPREAGPPSRPDVPAPRHRR